MSSSFKRRISVAALAALCSLFTSVSSSYAIRGCVSVQPNNPDDAGYANCLSVEMRGCKTECQALNRCFNSKRPPSTAGCDSQLSAYNTCRRLNRVSVLTPSGASSPALSSLVTQLGLAKNIELASQRKVAWSEGQGCYLTSGSALNDGQPESSVRRLSDSGISYAELCDEAVDGLISSFYGVAARTLPSSTDLRRDLGSSESEIAELATAVGMNFGVTVSDDVARHMNTIDDITRCVFSAAL